MLPLIEQFNESLAFIRSVVARRNISSRILGINVGMPRIVIDCVELMSREGKRTGLSSTTTVMSPCT